MCGRGRCTLRADCIAQACRFNSRPIRHVDMDRYRPSYNVAPVVRLDDGGGDGVVSHCMKWGLVPSFTKETDEIDHCKMFNARCESIRDDPSLRRLLPKNRCLVSFEGFYEWKKDDCTKQPYYVHFKDGRPLVFAALFDSWKNSEGETLYTFTIITTSSSSSLEWLHDRMPVILGSKESTDWWLDDSSLSNLDKILKPYEETDLAWYPVTPAIDEISFDGPECIKEVKLEETKTISQFFSKKQASKSEDQTPIKEELQECITPEIEKDKPQNQYTVESAAMKDEASVMEEPKQETTKMELIEDENLRLLTLKKRKEELKQELHQLTTLCDIPACMIIHDLATNSTSIWPEDSAQVRGLIDSYKADPSALRAYGVSDFISERQKNVEEKVVKLRKTNAESKYPSRDDRLDLMNESQLRELSAALRTESQAVRSLIIKCRNTKRKGCSSPVHGNTFSRIESERSELGREYVLGSHNPAGSLMLITHTHCFSVCVTLASASL
ncbi:abasic site processing protein HMCES-like isoform X1 [Salvia splendens]|uniref:abasic site processing protein HMCES-like isoform X1 n=1 Tax=Salvia splendens TaxID=180675 RepID=UPI001C25CC98|nr:abasic site processing protein HMCES-like isoform X1 [Salvia splendens]